MEALRKLRWPSKHRNRGVSPSGSKSNSLGAQNSLAQEEEGPADKDDSTVSSSGSPSRSGHTSPVPRMLSGDTLEKTFSRNENPLGLNVLHQPEGYPTVDIIFVHGLNGTSRGTWSKDKNVNLCWPEKLLPLEREICRSRVLSFGYHAAAGLSGPRTGLNIMDFAKSLLYCMKYGKDDEKNELDIGKVREMPPVADLKQYTEIWRHKLPIIFVVHSMGGLIVKKAYLLGQTDPEYKRIIKSIRSIIFLSTPHRGSNLAGVLDRILEVSFASRQYVADLKKDSSMLEGLNEEFRHVAPQLQIYSFYETMETAIPGTPIKMMVLNKESSVLGHAGEVSNFLVADHHDVCKFSDQDDPNYVTIRNLLTTLVVRFRNAKQEVLHDYSPEDDKKVEALLAVTEIPEDDLRFFHDRWMTGTCDWIRYADYFKDWVKHGSNSKILWLHGPPASGKSVLSSFVIYHLKSMDKSCSYFFFRFGDQTKRSPNAMLRSLAYQLALQLPSFRVKLRDLHDQGLHFEKADAGTIWEKVFVRCLFKLDLRDPLYWVIDALDECDSPQTALKLTSGVSEAGIPIHLLLMSRPTEPLSWCFQRLDNPKHFQVQATEAQESDIEAYVHKEMQYFKGDKTFKQKLLEEILQRADGSFLWVTLAMKEIDRCLTQDAIQQAFNDIPTGMEALYERMMRNIAYDLKKNDRDLAIQILTWVACARRAMTLAELTQAISSKALNLHQAISTVCSHFVVVDGTSRVAMIHKTASKYILANSADGFSIRAITAHEELLTKCLNFLVNTSLRTTLEQKPAISASPFLNYAVTSWPYHLHKCPSSKESATSILQLLAKFFAGAHVLSWIHALAYFDDLSILVQASRDLKHFVARQRRLYADAIPNQERIERLELVELWAADLLKVFAKFGPNLRQQHNAIHKLIPPFCPKSSALYLQYGNKDQTRFSVTGLTNPSWDDCLSKLSLGNGLQALQMECVSHYLWILMTSGIIILYDSLTLREIRRVEHDEFVFSIGCSTAGETLVSYGYKTTKLWSVPDGKLKRTIKNPRNCKALNAFAFTENDSKILLGCDDKTIRKLDLTRPSPEWDVFNEKLLRAEPPMQGTSTNTVRYMEFSPDASQIAVAYRSYPLSVWSISEAEPIKTLSFGSPTQRNNSWKAVDRVRWFPSTISGEILGLYNDGCVFKWNIYEEDTEEVQAQASEIDMSKDGKLFVTSDIDGVIKIWDYQHFTVVYQLSCENDVTDVIFSPDCSRLYDLSGCLCNVWEPNVLIRLNETEESASEKESEAGSTSWTAMGSEASADAVEHVTALDSSSTSSLYCTGDEAGRIYLYDLQGRRFEIYKSPGYFTIDLVHFNLEGDRLAYSEIGGSVGIFEIFRNDLKPDSLHAERIWENKVMEGIRQLLFSPDSKHLFIDGTSKCRLWDLKSGSHVEEFGVGKHRTDRKLINNLKDKTQFFNFAIDRVYIFDWNMPTKCRTVQFQDTPPMLNVLVDHDQAQLIRRRSSPAGFTDAEVVSAVANIYQTDEEHLVLHTIQKAAGGLTNTNAIIVRTSYLSSEIQPSTASTYTIPIPAEISSNVRKPLGFLNNTLVYLDGDAWVCTWLVDSGDAASGLKRHFFIPRDWLNAETLDLCQLMANGILLFPHYGEVAVIRCAALLQG